MEDSKPELGRLEPHATVLTYGTFDLFHRGHANLLRRAREYGELLEGVSTDSFNIRKGKHAAQDWETRALKVLEYADGVFPEISFYQKFLDIRIYGADYLIMGSDHAGRFDDLPVKVIYLPRTPGISSTELRKCQ